MADDHDRQGLADKAREAAEKVEDALEPTESDRAGGSGRSGNDASDPFSDDHRPDEAGFPHGSVAGIE
jgi:hypothetical protein